MRRVIWLVIFLAACASTTGKQRVVTAYQATQSALASFQDAEIALYNAKTVTALTEEKHRSIHAALAKAFKAQVVVGDALLIWQSGQPAPVGVDAWFVEVARVLEEVRALAPDGERLKVLELLLPWVRSVVETAKLLGVKPPEPLVVAVEGGVK